MNRVSFIVPVYRELWNGNLRRFADMMRLQAYPRLTAVFVVNNEPGSPALQENQESLEYLRALDFDTLVLDLSTLGFERNMGKIRQTGVRSLKECFPENPEQHIVVHLDADTRIAPNFTRQLAKTYNADAVFFRREYELRGEDLSGTHERFKAQRALRDLTIFLSRYQEGFATYQISSRLSTLLDCGGFKPSPKDEDTQLSRDLLKYPHYFDPDLVVHTEDRVRTDGFTSARRDAIVAKKMFPARALLSNLATRLTGEVRRQTLDFPTALATFRSQVEWLFDEVIPEDKMLARQLNARAEFPLEENGVDPFLALFRDRIFIEGPPGLIVHAFQRVLPGCEGAVLGESFQDLLIF